MTVWFHQSTILGMRQFRRLALRVSCILLLVIALITTLFLNVSAFAVPSTNQTIGFQGRLLDTQGNIVPDGSYNMQFKLYEAGSGAAAGNPDGTLKWTETYINNGVAGSAVEVKNGLMSVNLGTINPFGTSVDWNQDTLWLSMNVAGSSVACTTFGSGPCTADGEMLPMKRLTATPYALNAGAVNGKTADNFVQLGQGVQTDATLNTSSIFINKTGAGNLVQLQSAGTDIFTLSSTGDISLGNTGNRSLSLGQSAPNSLGHQLAITAGGGGTGTGTTGGELLLQGGAAGGTNGTGGDVTIIAGVKAGTGSDGSIAIGTTNTSNVTIGSSGASTTGTTTLQSKNSVVIKTDDTTRATFSDDANVVYFGNGVSATNPNDFTLQGTNSSASGTAGGSLSLQGGNATNGNADGGNLNLSGGTGSGTGTNGLVVIDTPTFSTVTNDANCYTSGAVVALSCTITATSVNNAAAIVVGFNTVNQSAQLPDPTNTTAGRIIYVTGAADSLDFTLAINGGGAGNRIAMGPKKTTSLLWNGSDWTVAGGSASVNTADSIENVKIGSASDDGNTTLLTLDKASAAPAITDNALLGSMYYDTTLGAVQCYEADGWGACSARPDNFISLSPEYSNTVMNGSTLGTITSDICSDTLNINNGTSSQPNICGSDETYNFYNWTSSNVANQTKSLYVTQKLPANFKQFITDSTSLLGRTDSTDATVSYQLYRNNGSGLVACGSATDVSTGVKTAWQEVKPTTDPATCGFEAGDSIIFKINLTAANDAHAYVSNLGFAYSTE